MAKFLVFAEKNPDTGEIHELLRVPEDPPGSGRWRKHRPPLAYLEAAAQEWNLSYVVDSDEEARKKAEAEAAKAAEAQAVVDLEERRKAQEAAEVLARAEAERKFEEQQRADAAHRGEPVEPVEPVGRGGPRRR